LALRQKSGYLPALLFLLLALGTLWSSDPTGPGGLSHYAKLLLIPIVIAIPITSAQALKIGFGFLTACIIVLLLSFVSFFIELPWRHYAPGIPFKDNAVQSGNFVLCAFGLSLGVARIWATGKRKLAGGMIVLALLFFADVFMIFISKTGGLMAAALTVLLVVRLQGWRRSLLILIPTAITAIVALSLSPEAHRRLTEVSTDVHAELFAGSNDDKATISTASRIDFWSKAVHFIEQAPVLGHGTGSTISLYQSLEASQPSPYGEAVPDPHNQFFAISIQVGLIGGALLLAMWAAHFATFSGGGDVSILGQAVVLQNIVGSMFNSHISTVTQGTLYCLAVGLLAGLVLRGIPSGPERTGST
jgi:O-antigen ligase